MEKDELYHKIDADEGLSDQEKREIYYSEIDNEENQR